MAYARDHGFYLSHGAGYDGLQPRQAEDGLYPLLVQDGLQVVAEALQAPFGLDVSLDKEALHPAQSPTSSAPETAQYSTMHDNMSRGDCLRARLVYQTWLSQTFPTHDSTWNKDKCPMPTCEERFDNIQSLLIHLEKHCKVLKHWECWDCSRAQQPPTAPSQRHCRWCRTKHFFDGLAKRVSITGSSLRKSLSLRKHSPKSSSSEHCDDVECDSSVLSLPPRMSGASYSSFNPEEKQSDGDFLSPPPPAELRTTFGSPSSSFQGLQGVHQTRQYSPQADGIPTAPVELEACLPTELPVSQSFSSFKRPDTEAAENTGAVSPSNYATPAKSWTNVSEISQFTASIEGCPSLVSPQTSTSSFSSGLSRLSIPESGGDGTSWFGKGITSSPTDCEGEDAISDRPPWDNGKNLESSPSTKRLPDSISNTSGGVSKTAQRSLPFAQVGARTASVQALPTTSRSLPLPRAAPSFLRATDDRSQSLPTHLLEPSHAETLSEGSSLLDSLISAFSEIRGTPFCAAGWRANSLAGLSDYDVLMNGLDELEHQLSGKASSSRSNSFELQLCFAYLGLAMAAIVKDHDVTGMMYAGLHQEMSAFIVADGEVGFGSLSERLRPIMEQQFLRVLAVFIPRAPHNSGLPFTSQTAVALRFMSAELESRKPHLRSRFSQNPSQTPHADSEHRQQSWSSSSSTLVDMEASDVCPAANVLEENNPPQELPSPDLAPSRKHGISRQAGVKRCRPRSASVCCEACEYTPSSGPDQQKKMAKHKRTDKHLRKTQQDVGSLEKFPCDFVNHNGIKCGGSFNRQDNLRQHQRRVHGLRLWQEVQELAGDEVDSRMTQRPAPKRRRTTRTGMGEPDELVRRGPQLSL